MRQVGEQLLGDQGGWNDNDSEDDGANSSEALGELPSCLREEPYFDLFINEHPELEPYADIPYGQNGFLS
jgi:hypothetical protein